jgi:hypothetical protein
MPYAHVKNPQRTKKRKTRKEEKRRPKFPTKKWIFIQNLRSNLDKRLNRNLNWCKVPLWTSEFQTKFKIESRKEIKKKPQLVHTGGLKAD